MNALDRSEFLAFEVDSPTAEPFGVVEIFLDQPMGNGLRAVVRSLHWTKLEAEKVAAARNGCSGNA